LLFISASILTSLELFLVFWPDNQILLKRDDEIIVKETGLKFYFNENERNNFDKYHK
jgi:hypothetical protein